MLDSFLDMTNAGFTIRTALNFADQVFSRLYSTYVLRRVFQA
jgi:hypothetical protein